MVRVDIVFTTKILSFFAFLTFISYVGGAKPKKCERPWRTFRDVCFFFADNNQQKFEDAQSICYKQGGFLASIRNSQEQGFIIKTVQGMGSSFSRVRWLIGLHQYDPADNKAYRWLDGSVSSYRNWMPTQPNSVYERCTLLDGSNGYKWRDEICSNRALFICRKDLDQKGSMSCFKGQPPSKQVLDKKGISVTECLEHCRGLGFNLAGTIPDKCFCLGSENLNKMETAPRFECNGFCQNQHCGNNDFVTIYNLTFYADTAESCEDLSQLGLSNPSTYVTKSGEEEKVQNCFSDGEYLLQLCLDLNIVAIFFFFFDLNLIVLIRNVDKFMYNRSFILKFFLSHEHKYETINYQFFNKKYFVYNCFNFMASWQNFYFFYNFLFHYCLSHFHIDYIFKFIVAYLYFFIS